jgi:hypothetical protein
MQFNKRETTLMMWVLGAALVGISYYAGSGWWKTYQQQGGEIKDYDQALFAQEVTLGTKPDLQRELRMLESQLPTYPAGQNITSLQLAKLVKIAQASKLQLGTKKADEPRKFGDRDLYEMEIRSTYQGALEPLTYFLYNLQSEGAALDIRRMTISPVSGQPGRVKGDFRLDSAYLQQAVADAENPQEGTE